MMRGSVISTEGEAEVEKPAVEYDSSGLL